MTKDFVNILIAEDHKMTARLLQSVLNKQEDMHVVDILGNGRDVIATMRSVDVDVLLLDLELPVMNGFDVISSLAEKDRKKVLILSAHTEDEVVSRSKSLGAKGYMSKRIGMKELVEGIQAVSRGMAYFEFENYGFESNTEININQRKIEFTQ